MVIKFDYDIYKRDALLSKNKNRGPVNNDNIKLMANISKGSKSVGTAYPNLVSHFTHGRLDVRLLEETASFPAVARSLRQLQLVAFPWCNFRVIPPGGESLDPEVEKKIVPKIEILDRVVKTSLLCAQALYDMMTYGSALFEVTWKTDEDGWVVPDIVQRLPAASFRTQPPSMLNNDRYVVGWILKGIIYDKEEKRFRYFQDQNASGLSGIPVEIPAEQIIHIRDVSTSDKPDGKPYLAGIVNTIAQLEETRKRMMQILIRIGAPNKYATVSVPDKYIESGGVPTSLLPGHVENASDDMFNGLFSYAEELIMMQNADMAAVVPDGIKFEYDHPSVPINPSDYDQYLIREAISHIFPRDVLEVITSAISTSSAPLLDLLKLMVQGWQAICSMPFETELWSKFLSYNGFEGYRIELDWAPLVSPNKQQDHAMALQQFAMHVITLEEYRAKVGEAPLTDEIEAKCKEEYTYWKTGGQQQQQNPMGGFPGGLMGGLSEEEGQPTEATQEGMPTPDDLTEAQKLLEESSNMLKENSASEWADNMIKENLSYNGYKSKEDLDKEMFDIMNEMLPDIKKTLKDVGYFELG